VPVPFEPREFFDSALLLTIRIDTDLNGDEATGTGFLIRLVQGSEMALVLVSNRHVFRDGDGKITLRFHAATDEKGRYDLGETVVLQGKGTDFSEKYVAHPDPEIDLGAAIVNQIGLYGKGKALEPHQIVADDELQGMNVGEPVWFVGYPDGWRDELHNLPLMRTGSVASLPSLAFDGRPEFVIDAQAFPGSSGSPVFARFGNQAKLVGVLAETRVQQTPVAGPPTILGPFSVEEVLGLGIVIRGTELPALLDAAWTRAVELIAAQPGGASSPDPADHGTESEADEAVP
jgi:hypothetical protein